VTGEQKHAPVLVLTNQRDFAADRVIKRLNDLGVPVERWNTEDERDIVWRPEGLPLASRPRAIWLRQHLADPAVTDSVRGIDEFLVAREQWRAWLTDLAEQEGPRWLNPLWASRRAENKLGQLRAALVCGFDVPPTILTNRRAEAMRHEVEVGRCIVKSVASAYFPFSDSAFMFTVDLAEAVDLPDVDWVAQPVLVQKAIDKHADVRVFVLADLATAVATRVDVTDWRTVSGDAEWKRFDLPVTVAAACRTYMDQLGLVYGAFDFVVDTDDCWWFLECNQAGEFAFADRPLELGVSDSIATWLAGTPA
jgi:glutathione synthase/RimK-type ligase-like ATP-grasp enzyme